VSVGVLAAALVALAGACSSKPSPTPKAGASATGSVAPPAGGVPSGSASALAANTHDVCGAINAKLAEGILTFGNDLGTMVGHLSGSNKAGADQAKAAAIKQLKDLAGNVRTAAKPAQDPAVREAAETTATLLERYAADPALVTGVKTAADVTPLLTKVTHAADALNNVCV
jgi:hypothetical protein